MKKHLQLLVIIIVASLINKERANAQVERSYNFVKSPFLNLSSTGVAESFYSEVNSTDVRNVEISNQTNFVTNAVIDPPTNVRVDNANVCSDILFEQNFNNFLYSFNGWFLRDVDYDIYEPYNYIWSLSPGMGMAYSDTPSRIGFRSDDWMWTPLVSAITAHTKLSWWSRSSSNPLYEVRVMTDTNGPPSGGEGVMGNQLINSTQVFVSNSISVNSGQWVYREVSLAAYAGKSVYLGFRHNSIRSTYNTQLQIDDIIVEAQLVPPTEVSASSNEVCLNDNITLTANCSTGTINWYNQAEGGVALGTGSPFVHSPNQTTTYYASCGSSCQSSRVATNQVAVNLVPMPIITPPANLSVSSSDNLTLTASGCEGTVTWSEGAATGTVLTISTIGVYSITATCTINGCTSEPSLEVIGLEIKADSPTITTSSANLSVCSPATHTLTASGCAGTVTWSEGGATGTSLTLSTVGDYSVSAMCTINGSTSEPSSVLNLTINRSSAAPTNVDVDKTIICGGSFVVLTGYCQYGAIKWYTQANEGESIGKSWPWQNLYNRPLSSLTYYAACDDGEACESSRIATNPVTVISGKNILFEENFDNDNFSFNGWFLRDVDNLVPDEDFFTNAWVNDYGKAVSYSYYPPYGQQADDWMWTPLISGIDSNTILKWQDDNNEELYEVRIMTGTDGPPTGGTGQMGNQITNSSLVFSSIPKYDGEYEPREVNLADYAGLTVYIGFRNISTDSYIRIDNIIVENKTIPSPTAVAANLDEICNNYSTVTLTATCTVGTPLWRNSYSQNSSPLGIGSPFIYNPEGMGFRYYASCIDVCESSSIETNRITLNFPPGEVSVSSSTVCSGTSVTLNAYCSPLSTLNWYTTPSGTSIPIGTGDGFSTTPTTTTTYYASCETINCKSERIATSEVTVVPLTTAPTNVNVDNTIVCSGSSVTLTANCSQSEQVTWYTQEVEGEIIGVGSPLVHQPLSNLTYYAACADGVCARRVATSPITVSNGNNILFEENFDNPNFSFNGWFLRNVDNLVPDEDFFINGWIIDYQNALSSSYYNSSPGQQADDWMWTPLISGINSSTILKWQDGIYYNDGLYEVRIMTGTNGPPTGGTGQMGNQITNSSQVFSSNQYDYGEHSREVNLADYAGQTVYIGFRNISTDSFISIDNIIVEEQLVPPNMVSTDVNEVCKNGSLTLTANCPVGTINWYNEANGGVLLGTGSPFVYSPTQTTSYYASCENLCQSSRVATNQVTVNLITNAPTITPPASLSVCSPSTLTLTANGCAGTVTWSQGSATGTSLTISSAGTYSITATCTVNGCTSEASTAITGLEIKAKPNAPTITPPASLSVCSPATLTLTANGCAGTVTWSQGSATGTSLTISTAGTYNITATCTVNGCTSEPSAAVTGVEIKAKPNAPTITAPASLSVCSPATLTLTASGCAGTVTWSQGSATGTSLTISSAGTYSVTATCTVNGCTSAPSAAVTGLEIKAKPNSLTITPPASLSVCSPSTLILTANGCAGTVTWSQGSATGTSLTISTVGTYAIKANCTVNGCTSEPSAAVTGVEIKAKPNAPTITPTASLSVCSPSTLTLTASGCAGTVTWSQGAATGTSLMLSDVGTYSITATCTVNGCTSAPSAAVTGLEIKAKPNSAASNTGPYTIGQTITLNGSGSGTYSWTGPNNFNSSLNNPLITNALSTNAGVYTLVVVGTNGCQATATTNVVVGSIDPCNISRIVDYLYVKAGNPYQPLVQLSNGVIINQITEKVSILINPVCPSVSIESFEMSVQGPELNWNILQNVAPYGLFDNFGLEGRYFTPGNYTLTVTGYAQDNKGGGITYGPKIISFVVVGYLATINTPTISKTNICAGSSVDVTFATLGTFNAANQFQVELSDSSGSFLNPVVIGRTNSVGTITCLIPQNTLQGTKYLIRVISSNQVVVSNAVISKITVNPLNYSLVSPSNNLTGTGIKKAVDSINASNKIISPANVVYQAGKSVLLTPGFESNGVFKAEIKACNN
jgi:hypothetical protein